MKLIIYTLFILLTFISCYKKEICKNLNSSNDEFSPQILNAVPIGLANQSVEIVESMSSEEFSKCIKYCCNKKLCDAILFNNNQCDFIHCKNRLLCQPTKTKSEQFYILFVDNEEKPKKSNKKDRIDEGISSCELNVFNSCGNNQYCLQIREDKRSGVCYCNSGYVWKEKECIKKSQKTSDKIEITNSSRYPIKPIISLNNTTSAFTTTKSPIVKLTSFKTTEKIKRIRKYHLMANAGPDIKINVLKSSVLYKPEIISIQGFATINNQIVNNETLSYSWRRLPESISAGIIANDSENKSVLVLTNLIQGQYLFELTVKLSDGSIANDTVKLNVVEIENEVDENLIEIVLVTNVYKFLENEKENFAERMAHVIEKHFSNFQTVVDVHSVSPHRMNNTKIVFSCKQFNKTLNKFQIISSDLLEKKIKNTILNNKFIFDYSVEIFQSIFCHNDCSGHGHCDQESRRCKCVFPWFNNGYIEHKTGFSNCDMHVMLVVASCSIGIFFLVIFLLVCSKVVKKIHIRSKYGKKVLQYKLLEDTDS